MRRCLSDTTLMRLQAGDGRAAQSAHLSTCGACADRYRRLAHELETVTYVLLNTDAPRTLVTAPKRSWVPVAAVAAALVVTLAVWYSLAVRRSDVRGPMQRPFQDEATSTFLAEVSLTIFSIDEPLALSFRDVRLASLPLETPDRSGDCVEPDWPLNADCAESTHIDRLLNLLEPSDDL